LVGARLAVGGRRIDQAVAALINVLAAPPGRSGGTTTSGDAHRADSTTSDIRSASDTGGDTRDADSDRVRAEQIACGCHAASALVARRHRQRRARMMIRGRRW
ncbi:hypothetical protein AB0J27_18615, partial [Micromonospora chokoriensis]